MRKLLFISVIFIILSHQDPEILKKEIRNKDFEDALNEYCTYLDSSTYRHDSYIVIEAGRIKDSLSISIYLSGGAYNFFHENVAEFSHYKNHDVLLTGDYPNRVINIRRMKKSKIKNIVKSIYPDEYKNYLHDKSSVGPLMGDYMKMTLVFKGDKLISFKRIYY